MITTERIEELRADYKALVKPDITVDEILSEPPEADEQRIDSLICSIPEILDELEQFSSEVERLRSEVAGREMDIRRLRDDLREARATLNFVERMANHHAVKPCMTAVAALSAIQHHPDIEAITADYADGKVPETPNPWAQRDEARKELAEICYRIRELYAHDFEEDQGSPILDLVQTWSEHLSLLRHECRLRTKVEAIRIPLPEDGPEHYRRAHEALAELRKAVGL